jgi:hypothetical protein
VERSCVGAMARPVVHFQQGPSLPQEVLCLLRLCWRRPHQPMHVEEVCVYDSPEGLQIVSMALERAEAQDFSLVILSEREPEELGLSECDKT